MDFRLLGPLEVVDDDGTVLAIGTGRQRALLGLLVLRGGELVGSEELVEELWGEAAPTTAHKMLHNQVSALRKVLDANGRLETHGRAYRLNVGPGERDIDRFEALVADARARLDADPEGAAESLCEALALWRGPPLSDLSYERYAQTEIARLTEQRWAALEFRIDAELALGRHADLVGELEAAVTEEPLREHLHGQLMLALYRSGRQADALETYRRARSTLVEEIGVEPGAELRALQAAILAQDPALDLPSPPKRAPPKPAPRRRPLLIAGALVLCAGLVALAISLLSGSDGLGRIPENEVGEIDPDSGEITAQYGGGRGPAALTAGGGFVWVANALDGTVTRIERKRDEAATIQVGGAPSGLAFGNGSLWVADSDGRDVVQVDPRASRVEQRLDVGNSPRALAVADGALWVASGLDATVQRVDLASGRPSRTVRLSANPTAMTAGAGALWVVSEEAGTVTRIDPRSGTIVSAIPVGNGPSAVAAGEGAIWVVNRHDGTLSRIDPETNEVSWKLPVGRDPAGVTTAEGIVWVAGGLDGTVTRVDPEGPRRLERIPIGAPATAIASADGRVWAAAGAAPARHRGGTLRVRFSHDLPLTPIDWLGEDGWSPTTVQRTSLAYDGLTAYRRVGGVAGSTLVGGLAVEPPAPSRDGRTFVFTLRRGLRYSDGRPVQPEDFRASMERLFRVLRGRLRVPFYDGIVGARSCIRLPARCDLRAGIATDRTARTITVRLTRPDADFLHKLTLPFAYVVPADTPMRRTGDHAPPGTGPYRFGAWSTRRGGELVRNPYFQAGSRPAGFADRIEVSFSRASSVEPVIGEVMRGAADVTGLAHPFAGLLPTDGLKRLAVRAPGQLNSAPSPTSEYMMLNEHRPPFDDVRVRRALNHATDRARVADLLGGAALAAPACRIVPAGVAGHEPDCPYGAGSAPQRPWTAPDPERAQRLMAASGTAGERVTVWMPKSREALGRYFVGVLDALGLRASLRVIADEHYFGAIFNPRNRAQIAYMNWSADYLTATTFIQSLVCTPGAPDFSEAQYCDPVLDRQIDRALLAQGAEAAKLWAAADRRVIDRAAAVPLTNRRTVVLVSKRVGNVQQHPQWLALLDQMWVR